MALPVDFETRLSAVADELWANSDLGPSEYATLVLGLVFLRHADAREGGQRFERLLAAKRARGLAQAIHAEMRRLEKARPELAGALPRSYGRLDARSLRRVAELVGGLPKDAGGDVFGRAFEYFFGRFAPKALQKGGEFYTPPSIVRLLVAVLEPRRGTLLDPACGSGGMFVQSARRAGTQRRGVSLYGIEKSPAALRLARLNLAVHDLTANLVPGNAYYDARAHAAEWGRFDFVAANPPFNQSGVDKARLADRARRFPFGVPSADNANALWLQIFYTALGERGRAGFVMANTASDARAPSEVAIRKRLLETGAVDALVALGPNLFYTVTLPVTLWFFDKAKARGPRRDRVLFVDARSIFRQVDRAHRDLAPAQIELLADVVRLYRGESPRNDDGGGDLLRALLSGEGYEDVAGLCRAATLSEIEAEGWALSPGRYVRAAAQAGRDPDFDAKLGRLAERLRRLGEEARVLERRIVDELEGGGAR